MIRIQSLRTTPSVTIATNTKPVFKASRRTRARSHLARLHHQSKHHLSELRLRMTKREQRRWEESLCLRMRRSKFCNRKTKKRAMKDQQIMRRQSRAWLLLKWLSIVRKWLSLIARMFSRKIRITQTWGPGHNSWVNPCKFSGKHSKSSSKGPGYSYSHFKFRTTSWLKKLSASSLSRKSIERLD